MKFRIRKVRQDDYNDIFELKKMEWGIYEDLLKNCLCTNENDHMIVAEVDGQIAAMMAYEIVDLDNLDMNNTSFEKFIVDKYSHLFETRNKICFLHTGITKPEFRRNGLARYLLYHIISTNMFSVNYFIADLLQRKDGSIPFKKKIEEYDFIKVGYEEGAWADVFDGVNTICTDCGPGVVCNCGTHIYYYDVKNNSDILYKKISEIREMGFGI